MRERCWRPNGWLANVWLGIFLAVIDDFRYFTLAAWLFVCEALFSNLIGLGTAVACFRGRARSDFLAACEFWGHRQSRPAAVIYYANQQ